jgi:SNF2 family DNA or RNA helicase
LDGTDVPAAARSFVGEEEWQELDGQEQLELTITAIRAGMANERAEIEGLLKLAERVEASGADAKAEALLSLVAELERAERDPDLKVLVFTEFVPTQAMLAEYFEGARCLVRLPEWLDEHGGAAKRAGKVAKGARVLISTDAGGEGLNLQFCHVVVNFDIRGTPCAWNSVSVAWTVLAKSIPCGRSISFLKTPWSIACGRCSNRSSASSSRSSA